MIVKKPWKKFFDERLLEELLILQTGSSWPGKTKFSGRPRQRYRSPAKSLCHAVSVYQIKGLG
jgi:hypothetical protein